MTELLQNIVEGNIERVTTLLQDESVKREINEPIEIFEFLPPEYVTPLSQAVLSGNKDMIELLLNKKADVNEPDYYGYTPLKFALKSKKSNSIIELLLNHNAIPDDEDNRYIASLDDNYIRNLLHQNSPQINRKRVSGGMQDGPLNLIEIPKDGLIIHINDRYNYNLENISKKELYNCNFDENYEYLTLLINKQLPPDNSYSFYYPTDFDESITLENIENKLKIIMQYDLSLCVFSPQVPDIVGKANDHDKSKWNNSNHCKQILENNQDFLIFNFIEPEDGDPDVGKITMKHDVDLPRPIPKKLVQDLVHPVTTNQEHFDDYYDETPPPLKNFFVPNTPPPQQMNLEEDEEEVIIPESDLEDIEDNEQSDMELESDDDLGAHNEIIPPSP